MTIPLPARWLAVAALAGCAAGIVLTRLNLSYDLAYFLPAPTTEAQRVLIDRVGQGPGSRMLYVVLPGATGADRALLAERLARLDQVQSVLPRMSMPGRESLPDVVFEHRYLLTDVDTSAAGLRRALTARLADLALVDDPAFLALVAADPHLASIRVLERLGGAAADRRFTLPDGTPFLLLDTLPPAFDLGAQQALVAEVERAAQETFGLTPELYGAGAYGVSLQAAVSRESTRFSVAAGVALAVLLAAAYRSLSAAVLGAIPLLTGALTGLAALALAFPRVHGITLAFGFTLMGVTVDYALHVLSHVRASGRQALEAIRPTFVLSVGSTTLAFLAFTLSGSRGLVQLGVFSAVGILTAAFVAWFLLPHLVAQDAAASDRGGAAPPAVRFRHWPLLVCLLAGLALLTLEQDVWNDNLASLTPVPAETLAVDRQLRESTGAPDIRYLVVSRGDSEAAVLRHVASLERVLTAAQADRIVEGHRAVTALVPDPATQARRRAALDPERLPARIEQAAAGTPFRPAALAPFVAAMRRAADSDEQIHASSYAGSPLAGLVDGMLYRDGDTWVALTFLIGLDDAPALAARLGSVPDTTLVDLHEASRSLLATYRVRLLEILGAALAVAALLLAAGVRPWRRLGWVLGTLAATVLLTTALVARFIGSLSLFDLVAVTLVAGLGIDYALFFSRRPESPRAYRTTLQAVSLCFASTALVFGLLSMSGIPVLHGIGVSVATGVVLAYLLAFVGRRVEAEPAVADRAGP